MQEIRDNLDNGTFEDYKNEFCVKLDTRIQKSLAKCINLIYNIIYHIIGGNYFYGIYFIVRTKCNIKYC